jgi:cytosine deaminase
VSAFKRAGIIDDPGCEAVLTSALEAGADLVGGAPYMDADSHGHMSRIFEIAARFDVDIDFHLDFSLDPERLDIEALCRLTDASGWGGRVAAGHVTKLSSLPAPRLEAIGRRMAEAGVALTVLPATDLFLMGRGHDHDIPRGVAPAHRLRELGVTCSISTNNVLNPFTPFGDASLIRMANLYANVAQQGSAAGLAGCLKMITHEPARLMRLSDYGIAPGKPADLVVLDCRTDVQAIAELAPAVLGYKRGRLTFARPAPQLMRPLAP